MNAMPRFVVLIAAVAFSTWCEVSITGQVTPGPRGKKVYISVDLEGISGVSNSEQTGNRGGEYAHARKLMAEDVNAAIRGAIEGGAADVLVNDAHGNGLNLQIEDLHPAARLLSQPLKPYGMMQGLDETFDAAMFIGFHAKAESPVGVFAHTQNGNIRDVQINGRSVGEGGIDAVYAAWHGVPVVLVTGDQIAVAQVQEVATGARGVITKRALNTRTVELRPLADVRKEIQATAREAVAAAKRTPPQRTGSFRIQIRYRTTEIPEVAEGLPGIERPAPDVLAFSSTSMADAFRLYRVLYRHINPQ
jgi:D-amino peptidase